MIIDITCDEKIHYILQVYMVYLAYNIPVYGFPATQHRLALYMCNLAPDMALIITLACTNIITDNNLSSCTMPKDRDIFIILTIDIVTHSLNVASFQVIIICMSLFV